MNTKTKAKLLFQANGTKQNFIEMGVAISAENSLPEMRKRYKAAQKASGLTADSFTYEVLTLRNVLDGRCPDGCCGPDGPAWSLTPGEWTCLAEYLAPLISKKK